MIDGSCLNRVGRGYVTSSSTLTQHARSLMDKPGLKYTHIAREVDNRI